MTTTHFNNLSDPSCPLPQRFRSLFALKSLLGADAALGIAQALLKSLDNVLLCHEMAYVLGQIGNPVVIPLLSDVLRNESADTMIRHEAAEALGAIGSTESLEILKEFSNHSCQEISQTCQLALDLIKHNSSHSTESSKKYSSVDPAPPLESNDIEKLRKELMDSSKSLFSRYRCMFALRDIGTDEAVEALGMGFKDESALFRHEIAYVFGQLQSAASIPFLIPVLENKSEHAMVRHEAAEALGSIGTQECIKTLELYSKDLETVVAESCIVGLDMATAEFVPLK